MVSVNVRGMRNKYFFWLERPEYFRYGLHQVAQRHLVQFSSRETELKNLAKPEIIRNLPDLGFSLGNSFVTPPRLG